MSDKEPFDPSSICEAAFLAGPERYESRDDEDDLLDIDDIFGKDFGAVWGDQKAYDPDSLTIGKDAVRTPSLMAEGYTFVDVEAGLLVLDPDGKACGGYIGCDLSLDDEHQGLGLGAELVLEFAMRNGWLPTWNLDEAAYSEAGAGAHRRAHAMACDRTFFAAKREELMKAMTLEADCVPALAG